MSESSIAQVSSSGAGGAEPGGGQYGPIRSTASSPIVSFNPGVQQEQAQLVVSGAHDPGNAPELPAPLVDVYAPVSAMVAHAPAESSTEVLLTPCAGPVVYGPLQQMEEEQLVAKRRREADTSIQSPSSTRRRSDQPAPIDDAGVDLTAELDDVMGNDVDPLLREGWQRASAPNVPFVPAAARTVAMPSESPEELQTHLRDARACFVRVQRAGADAREHCRDLSEALVRAH